MQGITCQNFKRGEILILQMLHGPNLLPSPPITTCPPHLLQPMFNLNHAVQLKSPYSTVGAGMYEEREEIGGSTKKQTTGKKTWCPRKETTKKTKKFVVEVGDSDKEE